ncbi:MAG: sugar phosphate isomerase/epimerase family protein [Lachnospiraceae bacterium]
MKISVFYDHILQAAEQTKKPVLELLKMARDAGIEAVEVRLEALLTEETIPGLLQEADLKISCIYEFYEMGNKDESEKGMQHIDMAAKLCAERILVVPGFLKKLEAERMHHCCKSYERTAAFMEKNRSIQKMTANLAKLVNYGKQKGVTVTVEDFDGRTSPLSRMYAIKWFLISVPGLKYTLDMGNFVYSDEDVCIAWELLQDYVAHVHCKDRGVDPGMKRRKGGLNKGLLPVAAGDGYLPIGSLLQKLKNRGYDGYLAIEHFDAPNQESCIRRSAEFLAGNL